MSWHRSKRFAKLSLKWLNLTILLPSVCLILAVVILLYTSPGLHLSLWLAQKSVPGLQIERSEGSVLGGNKLHDIRYQQGNIQLSVKQAELQVNNNCLFNLSVCADKLLLQGVVLELSQSDTATDDTNNNDTAAIWLPFPLTVSQLAINDGTVIVAGTRLEWERFSTGIEAWGSKVQLNEPIWQQVILLMPDNNEASAPAAGAAFSYHPPELADFSLPLSLFVDRFTLTDFTLKQQDTVQQLNALHFSLQWQKRQLDLLQLDADHSQFSVHASAKLTTEHSYPLQAKLQMQLTNGELNGQQLQLDVSGDLTALQLQADASGPLTASVSATVDLVQPTLPHQLQLQSEQLQWPTAAEQPQLRLSHSSLTLEGNLQRSHFSGHTSIKATDMPDTAAEFRGNIDLNGAALEHLLLDTLGGQLALNATLSWHDTFNWRGQVKLHDIQPGNFWPEYSGKLNGMLQHHGQMSADQGWLLDISDMALQGSLRDYALELNGALKLADKTGDGDYRLSTESLSIKHADNSLSVKGALQQDWNLTLTADIPALAQSVPGAKGSMKGEFRITGSQQQPELNGDISATKLRWQQLRLEQLTASSVVWLDTNQVLNARIGLEATNAVYQKQQLQNVQINLEGNEQQHQLSLTLDSKQHQAKLQLSGALLQQRQLWQGQLQKAQLSSLLGSWQLRQSVDLQFKPADNQFEMAAHCWQQQTSSICLSEPLQLSSNKLIAALQIEQFDLTALTPLMPNQLRLSGIANARLNASWQQGQRPQATLSISSNNGELTQQTELPLAMTWQQLNLNSKLSDDTLQSSLTLALSDETRLDATTNISQLQSDNRLLEGNIKLTRFALSILQPLLGEFSELQGELSSELDLAGSLDQPLLNGQVDISNIRVKGKQAPVDIDDADITLTLSGQRASLQGLVTTTRGEIKLSGDASWQQLSDWQAQVNITGDELRLQVPQARLLVAPDLILKATPALTSLSGSVTIPQANINIDSLPQNAIELSDDLILLDEKLQPIPQQEKSVFIFETDINVLLGNRVRLSAFGLKTLLNGKLRVRQQPGRPLLLNGDVSLQNGTFRAYGQDLLIRKGKMNFNGPAGQPFLNIEAIRNPDNMEDDVIAGIRVTGPADEPQVSIFSEPAKAQANALSYLIMGRDLDSGGGNTGNAVTTSLLGMTLASSSKAVGEIGEAFGLQDLTLDTAGSGDNSQVTVSGYLSRDLQLKYGYGIFNAVGEFTLRYRLMRRLYLEAVSGLDNAVDLLYKFEFD